MLNNRTELPLNHHSQANRKAINKKNVKKNKAVFSAF